MPIHLTCPSCAAPLDIVERLQGKKVCCPECKHVFLFTGPDDPPPEGTAAAPARPSEQVQTPAAASSGARSWGTTEEDRSRERSSGGGIIVVLLVAAVAGVLLLGCGGLVVGLFMLRTVAVPDKRIMMEQAAVAENQQQIEANLAALMQPQPPIKVNPADLPAVPPPAAIPLPKLDKDRVEVPIGQVIGDVLVGGGGRFLILHLPEVPQVAIFDVSQAKVVHRIVLKDKNVRIAAGMDHLVLATDGALERWSLKTFQREEPVARPPFAGKVKVMAMGAASHGPLLVGLNNRPAPDKDGAFFESEWLLLDLRTLAPIPLSRELGTFGFGQMSVRASLDGRVFYGWRADDFGAWPGRREEKTLALIGDEVREFPSRTWLRGWGQEGLDLGDRVVYDGRDTLAYQLLRATAKSRHPDDPFYFPAHHGPYYLKLGSERKEGDLAGIRFGPPTGPLSVFRHGLDKPLAAFEGLLPGLGGDRPPEPGQLPLDRRLHFLPAAGLIVTIPGGDNRLILQRFDADEALGKVEGPFLGITTEPPLAVRPGDGYSYQIEAHARPEKVSFRLEHGPAGMQVDRNGLLTWKAPANLTEPETPVVVSVRNEAGQEVIQSFYVLHPGNQPPDPRAVPADPPPLAPPPPPTLKPPVLERDRVEVPLPFAVNQIKVGGGGRYLILRPAKEPRLAIFDVNQARVVKEIALPPEDIHVAAGMDQLVVIVPGYLMQRWNLTTLERETIAPLPIRGWIKQVAMGPASNGPLLIQQASGGFLGPDSGSFELLDIRTLRLLPTRRPDEFGFFPAIADHAIQASADGSLFALKEWNPQQRNLGTLTRPGVDLQRHQHCTEPDRPDALYLLPGPDGKVLYTAIGRFTPDLKDIGPRRDDGPMYVPAWQGDYYLTVETAGRDRVPRQGGAVWIHRTGNEQPLLKVPDLDAGILAGRDEWAWPRVDQRLFLLPDAGLLVVMPNGNDRFLLQRLDLKAADKNR